MTFSIKLFKFIFHGIKRSLHSGGSKLERGRKYVFHNIDNSNQRARKANSYTQWFVRLERVFHAWNNPTFPKDKILGYQLYFLDAGQFNANFEQKGSDLNHIITHKFD